MLRRLIFAVVLAAVAAVHPAAQAPDPGILEISDSSAVVVAGRVSAIGVLGDAGGIYTYVTVNVTEVLKGQLESPTIVIKQLGGTLRDIGLLVSDQAEFAVDEDVLLFLAVRPRDETLYTAGLSRGKWRIITDLSTGGRAAVRGDASLAIDASFVDIVRNSRTFTGRFVAVPPELMISRPAYAFLPPSEGGPARWHEADDGARIPLDYQTIPGGLPGGNPLAQLDGAIGAWNAVNTRLVLERQFSGNPTCPVESFTGGGRIAFYWNDPCGEIGDGDSSTFGVGGGFFTPGSQKTINGVTFNKFLQGIAILNNTGPHLASVACLQDAATHVLGHAVGLGHSSDSGALMRPTLRGSCSGLASDDIAGLRAIYPAVASGGAPPNAPTAITSSVSLDTVALAWTAATSGGPAQNYVLEAGSAPGLANIATFLLGPATSTVVGAVPPGQYHVRVRARNALGTSGPSPDTIVNVGPCAPPGTPGPIAYSTAGNLVTLSWTPPATGIAQGYWLYAGYAPGQSNALVQALGPTPSFMGFAQFGHYYVRIASRNTCGISAPTADVLVSVLPCTAAPAAPAGLTFSRSGNIVTLGWTAPTSGNLPSRYRILAGSVSGGADILVHTTSNNATSFVAFAPAGRYYVRVQSQNNCGFSAESNEATIVVP